MLKKQKTKNYFISEGKYNCGLYGVMQELKDDFIKHYNNNELFLCYACQMIVYV